MVGGTNWVTVQDRPTKREEKHTRNSIETVYPETDIKFGMEVTFWAGRLARKGGLGRKKSLRIDTVDEDTLLVTSQLLNRFQLITSWGEKPSKNFQIFCLCIPLTRCFASHLVVRLGNNPSSWSPIWSITIGRIRLNTWRKGLTSQHLNLVSWPERSTHLPQVLLPNLDFGAVTEKEVWNGWGFSVVEFIFWTWAEKFVVVEFKQNMMTSSLVKTGFWDDETPGHGMLSGVLMHPWSWASYSKKQMEGPTTLSNQKSA